MIEVAATEFTKRYSRYREAAQRGPVAVTHHNRISEVLLSKQDYDEYVRLKGLATRAVRVGELSDAAVTALAEATMDPGHGGLDALMDD